MNWIEYITYWNSISDNELQKIASDDSGSINAKELLELRIERYLAKKFHEMLIEILFNDD